MNGCWQSGGPDWLFPLILGAGLAGVLFATHAYSARSWPVVPVVPAHKTSWWQRILPLPFLAIPLFLGGDGIGWLSWLLLAGPLLLTFPVMALDDHRTRSIGAEVPRPVRPPTPIFSLVVGAVALGAAAVAFGAMIVQGHSC